MKKGLKLGMLTMAFVAAMTAVISTGKVQAGEGDLTANNQVQVVIGQYNSGQNTCSGGNFLFEFTASTEEQTGSTSNVFECKFGNSAQKTVTLQLDGNLTSTSGGYVISGENVKLSNTVWTKTPDTLGSNSALEQVPAGTSQTLFDKAEKTIGDASGSVTIDITVPGGKPDGTYEGTLVLTF